MALDIHVVVFFAGVAVEGVGCFDLVGRCVFPATVRTGCFPCHVRASASGAWVANRVCQWRPSGATGLGEVCDTIGGGLEPASLTHSMLAP